MRYIEGESRYQTKIVCLDEYVKEDSMVRIIDRFVDGVDLAEMGFQNTTTKDVGRKPYDPASLVKLYVYGYEEGVRSSRRLETLTNVNIEAMWLMEGLKPDFKTIADFRKDNIGPLTGLLEEYNSFADYCGMFGKRLIAIDGTKIRANNNKKNNYSKKKLERNIEHSKERIKEYMSALDETDDMEEACRLFDKAGECEKHQEKSEMLLGEIEESGDDEISTVDPDSRLMVNNRGGVDVSYNVQVSVDEKAHLVSAFDITQNPTDHGQLASMTQKTQEVLRKKGLMALADKGYYGQEDIEGSENLGAIPIVARQLKPGEKSGSRFSLDKFVYDKEKDEYICPFGKSLEAHSSKQAKARKFFNKAACSDCPAGAGCLKGKEFRTIVRSPNNDVLDRADKIYKENAETYKLRQQIVEHVFGTVKRTMGGGYFLLSTIGKVKAEAALLLLGYNLKRTKNYLGFEMVMERLVEWQALLHKKGLFLWFRLPPIFLGNIFRFYPVYHFFEN